MWHSDHEHSDEEIKVLRELEYDLFMFDPSFREIWNNDFDSYFNSLFDEQAWEEKMQQAMEQAGPVMSRQMMEDPEFAEFIKEQAIIDEVLSGELKPEHAPVEMRQQLEQLLNDQDQEEEEITDPLYIKANSWASELSKVVGPLYEQFSDIKLFRVLSNCYLVSGKIAFAKSPETWNMPPQSPQWQGDKIGYTLALTSLRRCIESLTKLKKSPGISKKIKIPLFVDQAKQIEKDLIDQLDELEQKRLKNL